MQIPIIKDHHDKNCTHSNIIVGTIISLSNDKFRSLMVISPTMSMHQIDCNVIINILRLERWLQQLQVIWRKGKASRQVSRPQDYGNCSKTKNDMMKQNWASMEVSYSSFAEIIEIRTKYFGTKWNQVCAWKSLEMDFRLFLWFVVFLDVVWPMS